MFTKIFTGVLLLCLAVFVTAFFFFPGVFVDNEKVVRAVEKQGYTEIAITSSHMFFVSWRGCGKSDDAAYKMQATNSKGQRVEIIACAGWPFKGLTVRTK